MADATMRGRLERIVRPRPADARTTGLKMPADVALLEMSVAIEGYSRLMKWHVTKPIMPRTEPANMSCHQCLAENTQKSVPCRSGTNMAARQTKPGAMSEMEKDWQANFLLTAIVFPARPNA
jgi:hypothetical protein